MLPKRAWDNSGKRFGSPEKAARELGFRTGIDLAKGIDARWPGPGTISRYPPDHGKARGKLRVA